MLSIPSDASIRPDESGGESGIIRDLRSKIAAMKADLEPIYAGTAIIKKKVEMALEFEGYARKVLVDALNFLQCK